MTAPADNARPRADTRKRTNHCARLDEDAGFNLSIFVYPVRPDQGKHEGGGPAGRTADARASAW